MAERKRVEDQRGKKIHGRAPRLPEPKVRDGDQVNLTDGQSRIMPVSGDGFEQAYNCQAALRRFWPMPATSADRRSNCVTGKTSLPSSPSDDNSITWLSKTGGIARLILKRKIPWLS
jgi:hypothetical protein